MSLFLFFGLAGSSYHLDGQAAVRLELELHIAKAGGDFVDHPVLVGLVAGGKGDTETNRRLGICLLYTSDAADE